MGKIFRSTLVAVVAALLGSFAFATFAGAQDNGPYVGNEVTTTLPGEVQSKPEVLPAAQIQPAKAASGEVKSNQLAFTGSDAVTLTLVGLVAIAAGGSILVIRRRSAA